MIFGIGTDLIEIQRVLKAIERESFLNKIFTQNERIEIEADKRKSASDFAVKESVVKMFGTGFGKVKPCEIEVLRDALGKPYVNLYGNALDFAKNNHIGKIHVSITNTKDLVSSYVVGEFV